MSSDPSDLSNLHDIVLPAPVSFWPPAPGWWILAGAILAALVLLLVKLALRYRANAYRREALRELAQIGAPLDAEKAQALSAILKRAALVAFPRADVASLTGAAWSRFLDKTGRMNAFEKGAAAPLPAIALGSAPSANDAAIRDAARDWIRHHKPAER